MTTKRKEKRMFGWHFCGPKLRDGSLDRCIDAACWLIGWGILMAGALCVLALEWPK